jgi:oxaloacetate decarboxylase alpha subunit
MENQLKEQGAADKFAEVLQEIPRVREDLGYIPLVTPTSQIVGTQAVLNVLAGQRYKNVAKETAGILKGEYGITPAPVNPELQARVLAGTDPIRCRPADLLAPEMEKLIDEVQTKANNEKVTLADHVEEDALIYGLFAQIGWKFLVNRNNPEAFEALPTETVVNPPTPVTPVIAEASIEHYSVRVDGRNFSVSVGPQNVPMDIQPLPSSVAHTPAVTIGGSGAVISEVNRGDVVLTMEAMKMETEVRSRFSGVVSAIHTKEGAAVTVGAVLITL